MIQQEKIIKDIRDIMDTGYIMPEIKFYRGVGNIEYKLIPSAGRYGIEDEKTQKEFEQDMLNEFKKKAHMFLAEKSTPKTVLEWMMLAQHYGLPTRLLDWTYNPLVALFFAVTTDLDKDGVLYASFPHLMLPIGDIRVNYDGINTDPFSQKKPIVICPEYKDIRYINQKGLFVLHPSPSNEYLDTIVEKYIIPANRKHRLQSDLLNMGIGYSFIYSDMNALSQDIKFVKRFQFGPYMNIK